MLTSPLRKILPSLSPALAPSPEPGRLSDHNAWWIVGGAAVVAGNLSTAGYLFSKLENQFEACGSQSKLRRTLKGLGIGAGIGGAQGVLQTLVGSALLTLFSQNPGISVFKDAGEAALGGALVGALTGGLVPLVAEIDKLGPPISSGFSSLTAAMLGSALVGADPTHALYAQSLGVVLGGGVLAAVQVRRVVRAAASVLAEPSSATKPLLPTVDEPTAVHSDNV